WIDTGYPGATVGYDVPGERRKPQEQEREWRLMWCAGWGSDAEEGGGQWQGRRRWCMCCGEPQSVLDSARKRQEWGTGTRHRAGHNIKDVVDDGYGPEWAARSAGRHWEWRGGTQDGGRQWEAVDRAAGMAGCGGMRSRLADPKRAGNDGETPEEARVGCDGLQERLEGSASWGGQWGQVAGNGGLQQHGEWATTAAGAWWEPGSGGGNGGLRRHAGRAGRPKSGGIRGARAYVRCWRAAIDHEGAGSAAGSGKVRGGKPDWLDRRTGQWEGGERRRRKWWHFQGPQTHRYGTVNNEPEGSGSKLPFSAWRDSTAMRQGAASGQARARKLPKRMEL
ncbi:hypothetical protein B0H10DRAFT_1960350, partial [Mycena sp. CBHHK59/15]